MRRQGKFGTIEVRNEAQRRTLYLRNQPQGAAYLRPSAQVVNPGFPPGEPGPISSAAYALGWLVGAVHNPYASVLMVGLGSGAGAVQLLYNFPDVDVTVVEIDPVMAQMAIDHYPLISYYMDLGRLNIVIADANDFLRGKLDTWDYGCADAFTGESATIDSFLSRMCKRCDDVYINIIDRLAGPSMASVAGQLGQGGREVSEIFKAVRPEYYGSFSAQSSWIATTQEVDLALLSCFTPFCDIDDEHARDSQALWDSMIASTLSCV